MSYLVLARKHRPQTFEELVGQEAVSRTLKNSIESGRLAHAYLFFGPRGCGKTTSARVLAKALNCKSGPTPSPCGKCDSCREIAEGRSIDVLEIDAASHTGVENVRQVIIETVAFSPSRDRYKIFIIDEAHMLSGSAFNALLKTLEEPPAHVVFMLATTEPHKIPPTIFSRCQRYRFRLVPAAQVAAHLAELAKKEKLKASPEALELLAHAGGGSLRDSLSLMDQAVSFQEGALTTEGVSDLLGLLPADAVRAALDAVLRRDAAALWACLESVAEGGREPAQLLKDLRDQFEALYLDRLGARPLEDPGLKTLAAQQKPEALGRLLRKAQRSLDELRYSDSPRITLELGLFGLIEEAFDLREWVTRLENLEKRALGAPGAAPTPAARTAPSYSQPPRPAAPPPAPAPKREPPAPPPPAQPDAPPPSASSPMDASSAPSADGRELGSWTQAVARLRAEKPVLAGYLDEARGEVKGKTLHIAFRTSFHKNGAERQLPYLKTLFSEVEGRELDLKFSIDASLQPSAVPEPAPGPETLDAPEGLRWQDAPAPSSGEGSGAAEDPGVKRVLDVFPGKVRKPKNP